MVPVDDTGAQSPCISSTAAGAGPEEKGDLELSAFLTVSQEEKLERQVGDTGQLATASLLPASASKA